MSPLLSKRLALALFFCLAFLSYTWKNNFPYFYHSDEESKALQILYGYRNFWHPMLMINATRLFGSLLGMLGDSQAITMVGRTLAAFFSSIGVVCLIDFAWVRKGAFTACLTGFLLLTLPLLFEVSHYCKEDPALFMGFGLTLVALNWFLTDPRLRHVLCLGIATGIATSAKYPGAILIVVLLPVVFWRCRRLSAGLIFITSAWLTLAVLNYQWLLHFQEVFIGIERESHMLVAGHDGVAPHFPQIQPWAILLNQHGWPLLLLALIGWVFNQPRKLFPSLESLLGFFAVATLIVMSFSAKIADRYLLPIMVVVVYLAACGVATGGRRLQLRYRPFLYAFLIGFITFYPLHLMEIWINDFQVDSRAQLSNWIFSHTSKNDKVATSLWTRLPGIYPGQFISGVAPCDYVADFGTVEQMRAMDFRWIAVADVETQRFLNPIQTGDPVALATFQRRRLFYSELLQQADLRWSLPPRHVYNLHPGLKLYELGPK